MCPIYDDCVAGYWVVFARGQHKPTLFTNECTGFGASTTVFSLTLHWCCCLCVRKGIWHKKNLLHQSSRFSASTWHNQKQQESPANAKGSARQPWYTVRKSPNRPPFRIAQQYQLNLYIIEKYFQCATIPSLTLWVYFDAFCHIYTVTDETLSLENVQI